MMKRILAVLLVLVALLACTAIASGETEANYTDNVPPVVNAVTLSKTTAKIVDDNGDTITVTVDATDDSGYVNDVLGCLKGYDKYGRLIYESIKYSFSKDDTTNLWKYDWELAVCCGTGTYYFTVLAYDRSYNETEMISIPVELTNETDITAAIPVINSAKVTFTRVDNTHMDAAVEINAYTSVNGQKDYEPTFEDCIVEILDDEGDELYRLSPKVQPTFEKGIARYTLNDLDSRIQAGSYTLYVKLVTMDDRTATYEGKVDIPAEVVGKHPIITSVSFEQNGKILTEGQYAKFSATVLNAGEGLVAEFTNTSNHKVITFNLILSGGKYERSVQLLDDYAYTGKYVFTSIKGKLGAFWSIVYTPTEEYSFTFLKEPEVYAQAIILTDLDTTSYDSSVIHTVDLTLDVNPTYTVNYRVLPNKPGKALDIPGVSFKSSNEKVVIVDETTGVITAISEGSAYITVSSNDGKVQRRISVNVNKNWITGINLNKTTLTLQLGVNPSEKLTYGVAPVGAITENLVWSSDDPSVATVDQNGVVTAVSEGTTNIYLTDTSPLLFPKKASCAVTVEAVKTRIIYFEYEGEDAGELKLNLKTKPSARVTYRTVPGRVTTPGVVWSSTNPAVATVDQNGVVTAVAVGTAKIYADPIDGGKIMVGYAENWFEVNVTEDETWFVHLDPEELTMEYDAYAATPATFPMSYVSYPEKMPVLWTSSNPAVASVDQNGVVTAVGEGVAVITVTALDDTEIYSESVVTVKATAAAAISFAHKTVTIRLVKGKKSTRRLVPSVTPANASYKIRWSSSNPKIATVKNGVVTAKKAGICRITATIQGTQLKATVRVRVIKK